MGAIWQGWIWSFDVYVCVLFHSEAGILLTVLADLKHSNLYTLRHAVCGLSSKQRETNASDKHGRLLKDAAVYLLLILFKHETFCYPQRINSWRLNHFLQASSVLAFLLLMSCRSLSVWGKYSFPHYHIKRWFFLFTLLAAFEVITRPKQVQRSQNYVELHRI